MELEFQTLVKLILVNSVEEFKLRATSISLSLSKWQSLANLAAFYGYKDILTYLVNRYMLSADLIANAALEGGNQDIYKRYRIYEKPVEDINDLNGDYTRLSFPKEDYWPPEEIVYEDD